MSRKTPHQKRPCADCPWRRDVEPGQFTADRYDALRNTSRQPQAVETVEDVVGQPMFACHKTIEGKEAACAGWLAVAGRENLAVRLAVAIGNLPEDALEPGDGWPSLFDSFEEMAARQAAPTPSQD
ncbi:DUF6283 family protein [Streptomyces sp. NPDC005562]|uniref:DUF6283 family protein n=1 Tax=Streptomyces sp. NPDC005562 TaxID=3154890 RepID=UPI0033AEF1BE